MVNKSVALGGGMSGAEKTKGHKPARAAAVGTKVIDDARVCVTRYDFAPRAETGWHRHAHDYVITTLTDCPMVLEEPGGTTREVLVPLGTSYRRDLGVEHNVINGGDKVMSFVEIELK
jgi:quercetin dioxygenase-like cupin family protein